MIIKEKKQKKMRIMKNKIMMIIMMIIIMIMFKKLNLKKKNKIMIIMMKLTMKLTMKIQKNLINIINDDNQQKKEEKLKPPYAKYNELIYLIYSSLVKSNEQKDEIFNKIQEKISELKIKNELDIKEINAIENIKKSVEFLINDYNNNKILISIHDNSRNTYSNSNRSQNQDLMDDSESYPLVSSNNTEINSNIKININPFNFILEKLFDCNCGNQKIDDIYYYKLILNRECNNLDECFKIELQGKCETCGDNTKFRYKFETTPDILTLIFDKPKENQKFIKLNSIEEKINLKSHMYQPNDLNIEYKLIKALYVFNGIDDDKIYIDIPNNERNNYIPYILFYQKLP